MSQASSSCTNQQSRTATSPLVCQGQVRPCAPHPLKPYAPRQPTPYAPPLLPPYDPRRPTPHASPPQKMYESLPPKSYAPRYLQPYAPRLQKLNELRPGTIRLRGMAFAQTPHSSSTSRTRRIRGRSAQWPSSFTTAPTPTPRTCA